MRYIYYLFLLTSLSAIADTRQMIAVVDTGMPVSIDARRYLCNSGHKDFSGTGIQDRHGHGTMVAETIANKIDILKHCIVIIKWVDWGRDSATNEQKIEHIYKSIEYATTIGVKYINLSIDGNGSSSNERFALMKALNRGIVVSVAAGNDNLNLSRNCDTYPACYGFITPNFIVVASYDDKGKKDLSSNYGGPVNARADGGKYNTSKAAAAYLGDYIRGTYENNCTNSCSRIRKLR